MDNPGKSTFTGGSLHLEGLGTQNREDEEEEERRREEEEDDRWRHEEIQALMEDGFDDLPEDGEGSYSNDLSSHRQQYPLNQSSGAPPTEGLQQIERTPETSYLQYHKEEAGQYGYSEAQSSYGEHHDAGGYVGRDDMEDRVVEHNAARGHLSRSHSEGSLMTSVGGEHSIASDIPAHQLAGGHHFPPQGTTVDEGVSLCEDSNVYDANNYRSEVVSGTSEDVLRNRYRGADTSHEQLKLLYEARGRELDQQAEQIEQYKRDVRMLHHEVNMYKSEEGRKGASVSQLKILLSEKEEQMRTLIEDMNDLQGNLKSSRDENHKLHFELESAKSTISSLEITVSQLQAADYLSKNQQLHDNFTRKLKQSNQEEKDLLHSKLEECHKEITAYQQEVRRLRDELDNMRTAYDQAVKEKTAAVTQLSLTVETMRRQYDELLQSHDSTKNLESQLKIQSLECSNGELQTQVCSLEKDLQKAREDLHAFDMAMKLGVFGDVIPEEDSMDPLGIKKTLKYDDFQASEAQKKINHDKGASERPTRDRIKMIDELKNSLLLNRVKRDEIALLREELHEKQNIIKKTESARKDACSRVQELQRELAAAQEELAIERKKDESRGVGHPAALAMQAENVALRQELTLLLRLVSEFKHSLTDFSNLVRDWKSRSSPDDSGDLADVTHRFNCLAQQAESFRKSASDVEEHLSQVRRENTKYREKLTSWEKKLNDIQIQVRVSEKLVVTVRDDPERNGQAYSTYQKLLEDLKQLLQEVRDEKSNMHRENMDLQDRVTKIGLECQRLNLRVKELEQETADSELKLSDLARKKDEEKQEALESCRSTYMKFHEEAVRELKTNLEADYEKIAEKLKEENKRLTDELCRTKELYIQICHEKDELEDKLKVQNEEAGRSESVQEVGRGGGGGGGQSGVPTPDSGVGGETQEALGGDYTVAYKKKTKDVEWELSLVKNTDENTKLAEQLKHLELRYKQHSEEKIREVRTEAQSSLEELRKRCVTLEECNQILKDRCKELEERIPGLGETNTGLLDHENCRLVQDRQQQRLNRLNEEKEELIQNYDKLIHDLQNRYTKAQGTKLLETTIMEQENEIKSLKNKLKEQEEELRSITEELEGAKEREDALNRQFEEDVKKLTDEIQNLESENREKKEEFLNLTLAFQTHIKESNRGQEQLKHRLQEVEAEVTKLKEDKVKYNTLKEKYLSFQAKHKEHIAHYKSELYRVTTEYKTAKDKLLQGVKAYVNEFKEKFGKCIDDIIDTLRASVQVPVDDILKDLEQVSTFVKSFDVDT